MGVVYFYNMTSRKINLQVNDSSAEKIDALPATPYYIPNHSATNYQRYETAEPQDGQFGKNNNIEFWVDGQGQSKIKVGINVNFNQYPTDKDILIYLFYKSVIVSVVSDNNAYNGKNGETINVSTSNTMQMA